jgi:hypothetical protein
MPNIVADQQGDDTIKFFSALELLELMRSRAWLVKVTNAVNQHWQRNNAAKKTGAIKTDFKMHNSAT